MSEEECMGRRQVQGVVSSNGGVRFNNTGGCRRRSVSAVKASQGNGGTALTAKPQDGTALPPLSRTSQGKLGGYQKVEGKRAYHGESKTVCHHEEVRPICLDCRDRGGFARRRPAKKWSRVQNPCLDYTATVGVMFHV